MLAEIMPVPDGIPNLPAQPVQAEHKHHINRMLLNSLVHFLHPRPVHRYARLTVLRAAYNCQTMLELD